jgi:hypothetical protein
MRKRVEAHRLQSESWWMRMARNTDTKSPKQPMSEDTILKFFDYADRHPDLTGLLLFVTILATVVSLCVVVNCTFDFLIDCWMRLMRMISIYNHGWPPPHCDADGDAVEPPEPNQNDTTTSTDR